MVITAVFLFSLALRFPVRVAPPRELKGRPGGLLEGCLKPPAEPPREGSWVALPAWERVSGLVRGPPGAVLADWTRPLANDPLLIDILFNSLLYELNLF